MRLTGSMSSRLLAKRLRREMTPPEVALWLALRKLPEDLRFRRQHPAGDYVLDFHCAPARLAIEIDGEAHVRGDRPARDAARDAWLAARDIRVLRFAARDVMTDLDAVVRQIVAAAELRRKTPAGRLPPPPSPSAPPPPGGGG